MNILIIEDDPGIRQTLADILSIHGHEIITASTGPEGVALAAKHPDLVLCDIGLPGMDGYDVIAALHAQPATRDIPFIFLTARAARDDQRRGMALGADDYITKPFTTQELLEAIEARVRRQRPLRERIEQLLIDRQRQASANWSHELLTPLNGILGGLELIEMELDTLKSSDLREYLSIIRTAAEEELRLARKIMRHQELEKQLAAGTLAPRASISADDAARNALARMVKTRRADILLTVSPARLAIESAYLIDALAELLENAVRHSPAQMPIHLTGQVEVDHYTFSVSDSGPGLSSAQKAAVGPYVQFERANERKGLGIGLAIVNNVARLVTGSFTLADANTSGSRPGLRAILRLPLAN